MVKNVRLLFFGSLRDIMGGKQFEITIEQTTELNNLLLLLLHSFESFSKVYESINNKDQKQPILIMVNGIAIYNEIDIHPGDEIAFLPPVGGG